jgi:ketosteroid isomerase-like protein
VLPHVPLPCAGTVENFGTCRSPSLRVKDDTLRCSLLIVSISVVAAGILSGATKDSVASDIRAVITAQVAAWNRGDIDGFMEGYARSPGTEFVSGDKLTRGWQTVRDRYKKKYDRREKMGTLTFSEIEITPLSRDSALVLGRWKLVRKSDKPHGIFTLLFRRTPAGWRIVHDHTS